MTTEPLILGERDGLRVVLDRALGWGRLDPQPTEAELVALYGGSFWADKGNEQAIRARQATWWDAHYGDWIELARRASPLRIRHVLDIGCGFGYFLRACLRAGLSATGIDPNQDALREARKVLLEAGAVEYERMLYRPATFAPDEIDQVNGHFGDDPNRTYWSLADRVIAGMSRAEKYEMISALWVLEHLADPDDFLGRLRYNLVSGGVLLAAVPNDFSAAQMLAVELKETARPYWWIDPTHLNYWTPATFANLLGRNGFRVVEQTTQYQIESMIGAGHDYPANPEIGAKLHERVRERDLAMPRDERMAHYGRQAREGRGREIIVVAVKE